MTKPKIYIAFKGKLTPDNEIVLWLKGDKIKVIEATIGEIRVIGVSGWCAGVDLYLTPADFVNHFETI